MDSEPPNDHLQSEHTRIQAERRGPAVTDQPQDQLDDQRDDGGKQRTDNGSGKHRQVRVVGHWNQRNGCDGNAHGDHDERCGYCGQRNLLSSILVASCQRARYGNPDTDGYESKNPDPQRQNAVGEVDVGHGNLLSSRLP